MEGKAISTLEVDSDDYSTEDSKKRKASDKMAGVFERSKKTQRSPSKHRGGEESKLDMIIDMMQKMKQEQSEIKKEIQQIRAEQTFFREEVIKLKQENENLKKENDQITKDNTRTKKELKDLKNTVDWMEKERKENNIVVSGIQVHTSDPTVLKDTVETTVKKYLNIDVTIKKVSKIGPRICVAVLASAEDKSEIMKNKFKLKNVGPHAIYINDDLTKKEKEKQKQIREMALKEKREGKMVKIGYNKITVDGEEWRWNRNEEKLDKIETKN